MTIEQLRSLYATACQRVQETADAIDALPDTATPEDIETADTAHADAVTEAERTKAAVESREAVHRARDQHTPADPPAGTTTDIDVRVTRNEPTYRADKAGFFRDLLACKNGDPEARERLTRSTLEATDGLRHVKGAKEFRAGLTQAATAGGEFIAPLWMIERYAPLLRAGRAFADQCLGDNLPELTNSINVPKITTGASTAVQADAGSVSNTDLVTTSVTAQVQTIAGRTVSAYQDIDLGGPVIEGMIYADLLSDYNRTLDISLINGSVTNAKGFLNLTGINAVTYTDATPTGPELWPLLFQAKSQIEKGAFAPVDFSLWHPSTWNWFLSTLDSQTRPLCLAMTGAAMNAMAQYDMEAQGLAGNVGGIPVVVDANVPVNLGGGTNESRIGLFNRMTCQTFEGVPRFKVADQTSITTLQYQFVMWGYYGVAFGRQPKMISAISGTGMIVQAGF